MSLELSVRSTCCCVALLLSGHESRAIYEIDLLLCGPVYYRDMSLELSVRSTCCCVALFTIGDMSLELSMRSTCCCVALLLSGHESRAIYEIRPAAVWPCYYRDMSLEATPFNISTRRFFTS